MNPFTDPTQFVDQEGQTLNGRTTMLPRCLTCIVLLLVSATVWGRDALPIVVELERGNIVYQVAGQRGDGDALIATLRSKVPDQETLNNMEAYVIASKQVAIADLQNLRAALQKYGFLRIRFFTYWDEKVRMTELSFGGEPVPYTTDPQQLKKFGERTRTEK